MKVVPGTRRGLRLLNGCERLRKLLSQLPEAQITVENLTDSGDVNFSLRREELSQICAKPLQDFKTLIQSAISVAQSAFATNPLLTVDGADDGISAVEVLGGGVRMQVVQNAIFEVLGEVGNYAT